MLLFLMNLVHRFLPHYLNRSLASYPSTLHCFQGWVWVDLELRIELSTTSLTVLKSVRCSSNVYTRQHSDKKKNKSSSSPSSSLQDGCRWSASEGRLMPGWMIYWGTCLTPPLPLNTLQPAKILITNIWKYLGKKWEITMINWGTCALCNVRSFAIHFVCLVVLQ